jgi:hypothetical protein
MPDGTLPPGANPGDGTGPGPLGQPGIITPFEEATLGQLQQEIVVKAYGMQTPRQSASTQTDTPNSEQNQ